MKRRDWEAKLTPALAEVLGPRRKGRVGRSWYVDEPTFGCVANGGTYIARSIAMARLLTSS
jgi:putative transposase